MTTKIFLVRHAEAEGNLFRLAHGQYDSIITANGYRQLAYLRERFRNERIDAVYGSDLTRTHITASAIYVPKNLPFQPMPLLRELRLGVWEQMSWGEILRMDRQMYIDFNKRPDLWHVEDAETFAQVRDRMLEALRQIAARHPGGTVAATSHGAALRTLLGTLQGLSLEEIGKTGHGDNTAVSLIEVEGDAMRVVFRDDASHVPAEASTFRRQTWHKDDAATEPGLWYQTELENSMGRTAGAMLDETPAGRFAVRLEPETLRITEYEIIPELRGRGYGVQLLGQAVQFARKHGRENVSLSCPEKLRGYFAKYGFAAADENLMVLDIRPIIREIPDVEMPHDNI
ncbi:MAG: GNAT family N-acetyltransferase [Oscillospiraceae bacterium]|nr:GNAT family N-acetyltransferase [Oscillospiraceae bacterium]